MEYELNRFIGCYAERTISNLRVIDKMKSLDCRQAFEVTQLINSLFGLLIVPFEYFKPNKDENNNEITHVSYQKRIAILKKANFRAYGKVEKLMEELKGDYRFFNSYQYDSQYEDDEVLLFIEHLRNSLAHGGDTGLSFFPVGNEFENKEQDEEEPKQIKSVIFQDKSKYGDFVVELKVQEIRDLTNNLFGIYKRIKPDNEYLEEYENRVQTLRKKMADEIINKKVTARKDENGKWYISHIEGVEVDDRKDVYHRFNANVLDAKKRDCIVEGKAEKWKKRDRDEGWIVQISKSDG